MSRPHKILKNPALAAAAPTEQNNDDEERNARRKSIAPDQIPPQAKPPPTKKSKKGDDDGGEKGASNAKDRGNASAAAGGGDKSKSSSKTQISGAQLSALYNQVLKLSTENKINLKTTWSLPLIEHLNEIVLGDGIVEEEENQYEAPVLQGAPNFQRASVTIDASMKIYATRVDSVHTATLHIAGGIEEFEREEATAEAGAVEEEPQGGNTAKGRQQRHKNNESGVNTLEENVANLNAKKFDLEFAVDPLFRKTSAAFEAGGPRGLLLNHLSVQNGREIIFDSTDAVQEDETGSSDLIPYVDSMLDLKEIHRIVSESLGGRSLENLEISPDFYPDYKFRATDAAEKRTEPDLEDINDDLDVPDALLDDDVGDIPEVDFADHLQEQEKRLQEEQRDMAFPAANAALLDIPDPDPVHHDDDDDHHGGGIDMMDMDGDAAPVPADRPRSPPRSPNRRKSAGLGVQVVDMFDIENPLLKDYNYFDMNKLNAWSGPQHWKYRHTFQKKKVDGENEDGENGVVVAEAAGVDRARIGANARGAAARPPAKKRAAFQIDFSKPMSDEEFGKLFDGSSKASTTLSKKHLADAERESKALTLVPDVGYDPDKLVSLFLKPSMKITSRSRRSPNRRNSLLGNADSNSEDGGFMAGALDNQDDHYDAPADVHDDDANPFANDAPQLDLGDLGASQADLGMGLSASQLMGTQAALPAGAGGVEMLPQPKKVAEIRINYARQDKRIDVKQLKRAIWKDLCLPPRVTKGPAPESMEQPKSFQDALNLLPQDIPKATLQQVSVPYCFVCLLHLANEKHLSLSAENMDTLMIRQTPEGSDVPQADVGAVLFGGKRQK